MKEIKIKLIGINYIINMRKMFYGCYHLTSISEYPKEKIQKVTLQLRKVFQMNRRQQNWEFKLAKIIPI